MMDPEAFKEFVLATKRMFEHLDQRISGLEKQMVLAREAMLAMRDVMTELTEVVRKLNQ